MKNNKKKIAVIAAIVAIIAIISAGTLAWFNDVDSKTNKFAISGEDGDFAVKVMESSKEITGHPEAILGVVGENGIDYTGTKLIPGALISKKVVAKNNSNLNIDQWVRVLVTVPHAEAWKGLCEKYNIKDLTTIFGGHKADNWERKTDDGSNKYYYVYEEKTNDTITYAFYYKDKLAKGTLTEQLFESITIPGQLTSDELKTIADDNKGFDIVVEAHAVQATNNTATSAIEAFRAVDWPIGSDAPTE